MILTSSSKTTQFFVIEKSPTTPHRLNIALMLNKFKNIKPKNDINRQEKVKAL